MIFTRILLALVLWVAAFVLITSGELHPIPLIICIGGGIYLVSSWGAPSERRGLNKKNY